MPIEMNIVSALMNNCLVQKLQSNIEWLQKLITSSYVVSNPKRFHKSDIRLERLVNMSVISNDHFYFGVTENECMHRKKCLSEVITINFAN